MTPSEIAMAKAKANQKRRSKNSRLTLSRQSMKKARNNQEKKHLKKPNLREKRKNR